MSAVSGVLGQAWWLLHRYLSNQQWLLWVLAGLVALEIGLQVIGPQLVRGFLDGAQRGDDVSLIALGFLASTLGGQVVSTLAVATSTSLAWKTTNALRLDLLQHLLKLDLGFFHNRNPGELIERIDGDVSALAQLFSSFIVRVVANALLLMAILLMLLREDWRVAVTITVFAMVVLYVFQSVRAKSLQVFQNERQTTAQYLGFLGEHLAATEDLRANGAMQFSLRRENEQLRQVYPAKMQAAQVGVMMWVSSQVLFGFGSACLSAPSKRFAGKWSNSNAQKLASVG
jgi:ATP-binding cassette, subfamily B, bacterial